MNEIQICTSTMALESKIALIILVEAVFNGNWLYVRGVLILFFYLAF